MKRKSFITYEIKCKDRDNLKLRDEIEKLSEKYNMNWSVNYHYERWREEK